MLFAGIDPSLTCTGLVVLNEEGMVRHAEPIKPKAKPGTGLDRAREIRQRVMAALEVLSCSGTDRAEEVVVAIEGYAPSKRAFTVMQLAELGTALRMAILDEGWSYIDLSPSAVKSFAGMKGRPKSAEKPHKEVMEQWGFEHKSGDVIDAFVLAQAARASKSLSAGWAKKQLEVIMSCRRHTDT